MVYLYVAGGVVAVVLLVGLVVGDLDLRRGGFAMPVVILWEDEKTKAYSREHGWRKG